MRHGLVVVVAVALMSALSAAADAQSNTPAVALVLEVRGATEPALKPYYELRAGDKVALDRNARLVVLHYDRSCRTITIEGGSVRFLKTGEPEVQGGVSSAREGKCPRRLEARSTAGAIVMRGAAHRVAKTPAFIVGGARGAEVGRLRVLDDGKNVFESTVEGPQFLWPVGSPELPPNRHYIIEFLARDGGKVLASLSVYTTEGPSEDGASALVLID